MAVNKERDKILRFRISKKSDLVKTKTKKDWRAKH